MRAYVCVLTVKCVYWPGQGQKHMLLVMKAEGMTVSFPPCLPSQCVYLSVCLGEEEEWSVRVCSEGINDPRTG